MQRSLPLRGAAAFAALWIFAACSPVLAQRVEAEILLNAGRRMMNEGKWAEACEAFEISNQLRPRDGALLRLAECRELNQQLASAWSAYRDALARVKDPAARELAAAKVMELEPQLSHLTVRVSGVIRLEGLTLTWNGRAFDPSLWNRALPVDGGDHVIAARAEGGGAWQATMHVPVGGAELSVDVPRLEGAARDAVVASNPAAPTTRASPGRGARGRGERGGSPSRSPRRRADVLQQGD